ncbi:PD-(D/E)XK nuclease family protein [Clostridioides difficile]|nr:PD-(D/E)XK nuclease family protein [Clostridioides difficile]
MNDKLKYFSYSQNSINTYKSCPLKFKYKYIDRINWKNDDVGSREYYETLKT